MVSSVCCWYKMSTGKGHLTTESIPNPYMKAFLPAWPRSDSLDKWMMPTARKPCTKKDQGYIHASTSWDRDKSQWRPRLFRCMLRTWRDRGRIAWDIDPIAIGLNKLLLSHYNYSRSGNFRIKKLSYDKFLCKKVFVGMTPYRISINSAH